MMKQRSQRNRTLVCSDGEVEFFSRRLITLSKEVTAKAITNKIVNQELEQAVQFLPSSFVDLLILDPPYNLTKNYNGRVFKAKKSSAYIDWFYSIIECLAHVLKPKASVYVCSDWRTSALIVPVLDQFFYIRNRITWEREKGRGSRKNWKNNTEDLWFCTHGKEYYFDPDAVKLKRTVLACYRTSSGEPKDWEDTDGGRYRLTYPSNFWSDITVPFWSMPENTDHPTQKPEKLIAKLILASSREHDFVFDPFLGSGTTAVVAKKLHRKFSGVEVNKEYCCWAEKRLSIASTIPRIQGFEDGVFWERHSHKPKSPGSSDFMKKKNKTVYLVSCVKTKKSKKTQAQDLYQGNWFTKARAYVEQKGSPWFILSAKYGVLPPTKKIKPYEKTLLHMKVGERKAWAAKVQDQLDELVPSKCTRVVILAGSKYREFLLSYLTDRFDSVKIPLKGVTFGNQLKWFDKKLGKKSGRKKDRKVQPKKEEPLTKKMERLW